MINWSEVWRVAENLLIVLGFVFGPILLVILLVQPKVINFVRRWWALLVSAGLVFGSVIESSLVPWASSSLLLGNFWLCYRISKHRGAVR